MISPNDQEQYVKVIEEGAVARISFYNKKGNSLTSVMLNDITTKINHLSNIKHLKVLVIESIGKSFCAGASFQELLEINSVEEGEAFFMGFARVIDAMRKSRLFVIVKVHGAAVGGGVGIAGAGDYTVASNNASFKLSELNIGIGPFVISRILKDRLGSAAFLQMAYSPGHAFDIHWAKNSHLISVSCAEDEIDAITSSKAIEMGKINNEAVSLLKAQFYPANILEEMQELALLSGRLVCEPSTKAYLKNFGTK